MIFFDNIYFSFNREPRIFYCFWEIEQDWDILSLEIFRCFLSVSALMLILCGLETFNTVYSRVLSLLAVFYVVEHFSIITITITNIFPFPDPVYNSPVVETIRNPVGFADMTYEEPTRFIMKFIK